MSVLISPKISVIFALDILSRQAGANFPPGFALPRTGVCALNLSVDIFLAMQRGWSSCGGKRQMAQPHRSDSPHRSSLRYVLELCVYMCERERPCGRGQTKQRVYGFGGGSDFHPYAFAGADKYYLCLRRQQAQTSVGSGRIDHRLTPHSRKNTQLLDAGACQCLSLVRWYIVVDNTRIRKRATWQLQQETSETKFPWPTCDICQVFPPEAPTRFFAKCSLRFDRE